MRKRGDYSATWLHVAIVGVLLPWVLANDDDSHKSLFPLNTSDYLAALCVAVAVFLEAGAGVGGGGILVPVFVLVLGFDPKLAIPLSNATIFGSAIVNTIFNAPKRHPLANRPLIDWDLMLIMQPATAGGALLGSFINKVLPSVVLIICLAIILVLMAFKTIKRGLKLFAQETATAAAATGKANSEPSAIPTTEEEKDVEQPSTTEVGSPTEASGCLEVSNHQNDEEIRAIAEAEKKTDWRKPLGLALVVGIIAMLTTLSTTEFKCGSAGFWSLNAMVVPVSAIATVLIGIYLIRQYQHKQAINYPTGSGDIAWDKRNTTKSALFCVVAGVLAGMFGIGGGMIQGPLMLEMGVHPMATSATAATLILYTSAVATLSYQLRGQLVLDYAVAMALVGIVFTAFGQLSAQRLIDITGRQSMIIFLIATIIAISTVLLTYVGVSEIVADPSSALDASGVCA